MGEDCADQSVVVYTLMPGIIVINKQTEHNKGIGLAMENKIILAHGIIIFDHAW